MITVLNVLGGLFTPVACVMMFLIFWDELRNKENRIGTKIVYGIVFLGTVVLNALLLTM